MEAKDELAEALGNVLSMYEKISRQQINYQKSSMMSGKNVLDVDAKNILGRLAMQKCEGNGMSLFSILN